LLPGSVVPDIALPATNGGTVSLATFPGRALVCCYPWTGRPGVANPPGWDIIPGAHGSTPQLEGLRDHHGALSVLGIRVFALSTQDMGWQSELAARLSLPFPLLSDHRFELARAMCLPTFETGGVSYLRRLTLVVRDGLINQVVYPVHPPDSHALEMVAQLSELPTRF
jgi:peroxiredoxin